MAIIESTSILETQQLNAIADIIDEVTEGKLFDTITDRQWSAIELRAIKELKRIKEREKTHEEHELRTTVNETYNNSEYI